jgi:hypothetical protein
VSGRKQPLQNEKTNLDPDQLSTEEGRHVIGKTSSMSCPARRKTKEKNPNLLLGGTAITVEMKLRHSTRCRRPDIEFAPIIQAGSISMTM